MQWYYSKNNTQLGPVEESELRAKLASGEIIATDLIWREGMADWLPAGRVPELGIVSPVAPANYTTTPDTIPSPYTPPSYMPPQIVAGSGKATASMVLGIVGLVFSFCGCFNIVLSLPCGILAIVFGGQVKALGASGQVPESEMGKAKAGIIMGWIAIGITVLVAALMMAGQVSSGVFNELRSR